MAKPRRTSKQSKANRGNFSRHRAGPDRRPRDRGRRRAIHHARAHAVRGEGRAAGGGRTRRRDRRAAVRSEPSAARQDAGPAGAASRAAHAAEHRAGPDQQPDAVVGHARRAADRRSAAGYRRNGTASRRSPRSTARPGATQPRRSRAERTAATATASRRRAPKAPRPRHARRRPRRPRPATRTPATSCRWARTRPQADAEQQRARLGFQGFESKVTQRDAGGVTYYRVRIGPFAKFEDMNTARQRLSDAGVDTAVIRFSKQ